MNLDRKVKIVSTIGPGTSNYESLEQLLLTGVNVFRLNFSHGEYSVHKSNLDMIREIQAKHNKSAAIIADLQGPKLRVGKFKNDGVVLTKGQEFILDDKDELGDETRVKLPHPEIFKAMKVGDSLLVDDGKLKLRVKSIDGSTAITEVVVAGRISNAKGVNYPDGVLNISPLTTKDLKDLDFALSLGVDYVALSFVQRADDVRKAKEIIGNKARIISKLEKPSVVDELEEIITESDAIMIARGDLGVELPPEQVPVLQKRIIMACRKLARPVIVATQMLESMINSPVATRAEASDVANAVYDGADAIMLSAETAVGQYPLEAVSTMVNIIKSVESDEYYEKSLADTYFETTETSVSSAVSYSATRIALKSKAKAIVCFTSLGTTAERIARERKDVKVFACTFSDKVYRQLALVWGVNAFKVSVELESFATMINVAKEGLVEQGLVKKGDTLVVVAGIPLAQHGITNTIRVVEV